LKITAKLNTDNGFQTRTTETPAYNTGLAVMAGDVVNSTFVHLINFSACGQLNASKPPPSPSQKTLPLIQQKVTACFYFLNKLKINIKEIYLKIFI
jgi:hypothetical protein